MNVKSSSAFTTFCESKKPGMLINCIILFIFCKYTGFVMLVDVNRQEALILVEK